ncbi:hypothetical protein IEO21_06928 [Rhodonia placenta]|uniref:HhH-GPD domain-containing protein n=1 Tax=Rhodonia placenta TaxID=104341 RepID=A0A8H7U0U9_9APHY|nr:hypothetical protein IEO21_06928 [Postia placenta]
MTLWHAAEYVAHDPWKLLVAVTLLNKTAGTHAVPAFLGLMDAWPTAHALARAPQGVLQARIAHLGLGRSRSERLIALSQAYCADPPVRGNVRPSRCYVDVGVGAQRQRYPPTEASHLPGSGPYALDSYRIFCAGEDEWKAVMPRDKELVRYLRWNWAVMAFRRWEALHGPGGDVDIPYIIGAVYLWETNGMIWIRRGTRTRSTSLEQMARQLALHAARASHWHVRLLSALDATDALRAQHRAEIVVERRAAAALARKLEAARRYIREAQADWDDMREALSAVVEKEPLNARTMTCKKARENQDSHRALYAHAQTIILTLRAELESERTAHAHTRQQTESEILSLSARLARREAELEACVAQAHVHPPAEGPPIKDSYSAPSGPSEHAGPARRADFMGVAGNGLDAHSSSSQRSTSTLTQDDAVQILDFSASRNRALEAESQSPRQALIDRAGSKTDPQPPSRASSRAHLPQTPQSPPPFSQAPLGSPLADTEGQNDSGAGTQGRACVASNDHTELTSGGSIYRLRETIKTLQGDMENVCGARREREDWLQRENDRLRVEVARLLAQQPSSTTSTLQNPCEVPAPPLQASISAVAIANSASPPPDGDVTLRPCANADLAASTPALLDANDDAERSMELATPLQPTILSIHMDEVSSDDPHSVPPIQGHANLPSTAAPEPPLVPLPDSPSSPEFPSWLLPSVDSEAPLPFSLSMALAMHEGEMPGWWAELRTPPSLLSAEGTVNRSGETDGIRRQSAHELGGVDMGAVEGTMARLDALERELDDARQELEARDEELRELRGVVQELMELVYADAKDSSDGDREGDGDA